MSYLCETTKNNNFLSKYQVESPFAAVVAESLSSDSSVVGGSGSASEGYALPEDYRPTEYDVHCGRGKGCYSKPGNKRFRAIVGRYVSQYVAAKTMYDKTAVLNAALGEVQGQNNNSNNRSTLSVNYNGTEGRWYAISEDQAREKVGHCMRDAIAALDGAEERQVERRRFDTKHGNLLDDQRAIFRALVSALSTKKQNKGSSQFQQARRKLVAQ